MSGFGTLIGVTFVIGLLLSMITSTFTMNLEASSQSFESLSEHSLLFEKELKSKIRIDNVQIKQGGTVFTAKISNIGSYSIRASEFYKIDLILDYTNTANVKLALRIPFSQRQTQNKWTVKNIYTDGVIGEASNPIRLTTLSGHWDPNEQIEIEVQFSSSYAINQDKPLIMTFSLPNGVKTSFTYLGG
ncbi:MAG: hypothetical protein QXX95_03670 [Nitrososphaerales archaeon]